MQKSKKISYLAILTGLASAIYYFETFLPLPVAVPGAKWGFSNFPVLMAVVNGYGYANTIFIAFLKTLLGSLLSGKILSPTFLLGLTGSLVSSFMMVLAYKNIKKIGVLGVSEIGAFFSNIFQVIVAWLFVVKSTGIFWYLPYMIIFGAISAFINSSIVSVIKRSLD
ncbi:MAG: Gx transporter family protein [Thermotogota bacterium]